MHNISPPTTLFDQRHGMQSYSCFSSLRRRSFLAPRSSGATHAHALGTARLVHVQSTVDASLNAAQTILLIRHAATTTSRAHERPAFAKSTACQRSPWPRCLDSRTRGGIEPACVSVPVTRAWLHQCVDDCACLMSGQFVSCPTRASNQPLN